MFTIGRLDIGIRTRGAGTPPVPAAPVSSSAPAITGSPLVGTSLSCSTGGWTGFPAPTFTYQWIWADTSANISGATSSTYTPISGDLGHTLKCAVTATNSQGNATANSNTTAAVVSGSGASPVFTADFLALSALPTGVSLSRATTGDDFNASGVLQSVAIDTARFDHAWNGSAWVATGLLIEGQRTNLVVPSTGFATNWSSNNLSGADAAATSPDGTTTATKLKPSGTSNPVSYKSVTTSGLTTCTVFAKAGEYTKASIRIDYTGGPKVAIFNLSTGAVISAETGVTASIQDCGNGQYRLCATVDVGASGTVYHQFGPIDDGFSVSGGNITLGSFDNTKGVYCWGADMEPGPFATSYIPTTSAAVTRSADIPSAGSPLDGYLAAGPSVWEFQDEATGTIARTAYAAGAFDWPVNKWYRSMGVYPAGTDTSGHMVVGSSY